VLVDVVRSAALLVDETLIDFAVAVVVLAITDFIRDADWIAFGPGCQAGSINVACFASFALCAVFSQDST